MTATGLVFGAFIGYLASAQQIFQEMFGMGKLFPICFGTLAITLGAGVAHQCEARHALWHAASCRTGALLGAYDARRWSSSVVALFYVDGKPPFLAVHGLYDGRVLS